MGSSSADIDMTDTPATPAVRSRRLADAPWLVQASTQAVFAALERSGWPVRAVGGVVRNALLGRPIADIDIATPATPQDVIAACERAGLATAPTGIAHGTVTVIADDTPFEVTTLRRDVSTDGRRATVAFTDDWGLDAGRRDFTMNALYCEADGTVHDPLGGYEDVLARRVRFIGDADAKIAEDYLRILRFFRFNAELAEGPMDAKGLAACVRGRNGLAALSAERIHAEMIRLLVAARAVETIATMHAYGFLPGLIGTAPRPGLFKSLVAAEAVLQQPADAMLRLSALAIAVEEDEVRIAERWRLSRAESTALAVIDDRLGEAFAGLDERGARCRLYRLGAATWRRLCLALYAVAPSQREVARRLIELPARWTVPTMPLRGADILARGVQPGPLIGAILAEVEAWWMANDFPGEAAVQRELPAAIARVQGAGARTRPIDPA
jgi:poly(A) polymerase